MEGILKAIVDGGPIALNLVLATLLLYVNKERVKGTKTIAKLHDEKDAMYREWHEESAKRNERLHTALSNSTIAMTANTASTESLKSGLTGVSTGLQAIMSFLGGSRLRGGE
jgi:hypothetical protein